MTYFNQYKNKLTVKQEKIDFFSPRESFPPHFLAFAEKALGLQRPKRHSLRASRGKLTGQ